MAEKPFDKMTSDELKAYAVENEIFLGEASTNAERIAIIKDTIESEKPVEIEVMNIKMQIKPSVMNDTELVEWIDEVMCGNPFKFPKACKRVLGEDYQKCVDPLRNKRGVIPADKTMFFLKGIVEALGAKNA